MTPRSPSPSSSSSSHKYVEELQDFIADLSLQPSRDQVASEIEGMCYMHGLLAGVTVEELILLHLSVLRSIYGDEAIRLWKPSTKDGHTNHHGDNKDSGTIRYEAILR